MEAPFKVKCIKRGTWVGEKTGNPTPVNGPKFGEVLVVNRLTPDGYYLFGKYPHPGEPYYGWDPIRFIIIQETRERIKYVAVSETLRETAVEIAAVESN